MRIRHATLARNLDGIRKLGLLCCKSRGRLKVVWTHATSKTPWAMLHVVKRHGGKVEDVVILEIEVPRRWLRRNRRGLWYCKRDIPPARLRGLIRFAELAASPVSDVPSR